MFTRDDIKNNNVSDFLTEANKKIQKYRNIYHAAKIESINEVTRCKNCMFNNPYLNTTFCRVGGFITQEFYTCKRFYIR